MKMRKPHKTILLVCTLFFTNAIALNLPFSIDLLAPSTSISSTANLTHSEKLLPQATATTVGAQACYSTNVPLSPEAWRSCCEAIWRIPSDLSQTTFKTSEFPRHYRYGSCTVTLTLPEQDTGTWWSVEWMAVNAWYYCRAVYPDTLRGASTYAGNHGKIFVRIWYEEIGNVAEGGVTAREIGDDGVERGNDLEDLSEER